MSLLVRKIEKGKWMQYDILHGEDVSADAITLDLRTKDNTLSVWEIPDEQYVDAAVLAFTAKMSCLETIDFVVISKDSFTSNGINVITQKEDTPFIEMCDAHRNIIKLNHSSLGIVAEGIVNSIKTDNSHRRTKNEIKKLIEDAIIEGRIEKSSLSIELQKKIK
jgi:hypothetical protein